MSEQEQFLKDIKSDSPVLDDKQFADIFDSPKKDDSKAEKSKPEEGDEIVKNRRERRMDKRMKEMEAMNIALNERIQQLSKLDRVAKESSVEDPDEIKVFGTDEQGKILKGYFNRKFTEIREEAEKSALEKFREEQNRESEDYEMNSKMIDDAFDRIEEKYNVDISSDTPQSKKLRNEFIDFIDDISPKDSNGDITEYADFDSSFEKFQRFANSSRETNQRQKELASRSMTRSGATVSEIPKGPITFKTVGKLLDSMRGN